MLRNPFRRRPSRPQAALAKLDEIEREMQRIGYWADKPPDLQAMVEAGTLHSFLDAPSFELWLQCIFLPNARAAARADDLPETSAVGQMAQRQYDYHAHVAVAQPLLQLLREFDRIIEAR